MRYTMQELSYKIYKATNELPDEWDAVNADEFLNYAYLKAQEDALPLNMTVFYIAVFQAEKLVGKASVQRIKVTGSEVFQHSQQSWSDDLLKLLNINVLSLGNVKLTGEHAYVCRDSMDLLPFLEKLKEAFNQIKEISKQEKIKIHLMGVKDFYAESNPQIQEVFSDYKAFVIQPNMKMRLRNEWKSWKDYLDALRSKYRIRAKRAFKKSASVTFKELNLKDVEHYNDRLYQLYLNVWQNAGFSLYKLSPNYFYAMKFNLQHKFKIYGGFTMDKLICFYSIIENHEQLEAGFLGYENQTQEDYQLYLRSLYEIIQYGIDYGFDEIDFSRTALEIKSSVGAEPIATFGLLKHTNPIINRGLRSVFAKFYQPEAWTARSPFKQD